MGIDRFKLDGFCSSSTLSCSSTSAPHSSRVPLPTVG